MKSGTKAFAGATALLLGLSLAACSSSDSGSGASGTASETASASFDPTTVQKDEELAALAAKAPIGEDGTLVLGVDTSYAPAEFIADDGKTPIGYDIDLAKATAALLGLEVDIQTSSFDSIIPGIGTKYDAGWSSFTVTNERLKAVDFVSYFTAGEAYAVQKGNPQGVDSANLCGVAVGVQTGTIEDEEIQAASDKCTQAGNEAIGIQRFDAQSDVTTALVGGKVDIMFADSPIIGYAITQTNGQLEQLGDVIENAVQGVAVKKGDTASAEVLQKAIQKLIDDGTYDKVLTTWGVTDGAIPTSEINPTVSD